MSSRILSGSFVRLSLATSAFFLGFSVLIPVLPRFLVATGKTPVQVGILLGAFSVTALFLRPFVGREVDRRGRKPFLIAGLGLAALASAGYTLVEGFGGLLALRLVHGAGIACFYPSAAAVAADLSPPHRRAEVLSYFSMFMYAGMALGPVVGESVAPPQPGAVEPTYFAGALLVAAGLAAAGLLAALALREASLSDEPPARSAPLLNRAAAFPASVLCLAALGWAATAYVPLYAEGFGGESRVFFFVMAVTVIVMRAFVGRIADTWGRPAVVVPGTLLAGAGVAVLAAGPASPMALAVSGVVFGMGWGALFPGLITITLDRVSARGRGSAVGTFTAAFDLAFGGGQALLGVIWGIAGFRVAFWLAATACLVACVWFLAGYGRSQARHPAVS